MGPKSPHHDDTEGGTELEPMLGRLDEPPSKQVTFEETEASRTPSHTDELAHGEKLSQHLATSVAGPWISYASRRFTNLDGAEADYRPSVHKYFFRRPRALLYTPSHEKLKTDSPPKRKSEPQNSYNSRSDDDSEERSTDNVAKQLSRLELFTDLIYVGIVANLSSNFSEQAFAEDSSISIGIATLEFILLFLPIWRVWDFLRSYGSNYFIDDGMQRAFTIWILMLALLYGINAPFAYTTEGKGDSLQLLIGIYLVANLSFLVIHFFQSIFLPYLRRQVLFRLVTTAMVSGLWISAIWTPYPGKIVVMVLANIIEIPIDTFLASPKADAHLTKGYTRSMGTEHYIERHEEFFIVILGEGIYRLVEGSPTGFGLNSATGTVLTALMIYYVLHWLYFNGDQSKKFMHALRRTWYKPVLWRLFHIVLFASLLFLDIAILFLIENTKSLEGIRGIVASEPTSRHLIRVALWTASIALSVVLLSMTAIALLNRPLDPPGTILISSRLVRIAPRFLVMAIILCLPLVDGIEGSGWCAAAVGTLYLLLIWEWIVGLEKEWAFFEPKND